jgi:hypothetical protein
VIIDQFNVTEKLSKLEDLMSRQPEGSFGVALSDIRPSSTMRSLICRKKQEECDRLQTWLSRLERYGICVLKIENAF